MTPEALQEKYFTQGLTPEEQQELDAYLTKHPELAEAFKLEKDLKNSLISSGAEKLRDRLKGLEVSKNLQTQTTVYEEKSRKSFLKYAIAAAIVIGCTLFAVESFTPDASSSDELYAQYFEPYRNIIAPIERGETELSDEEKAFQLYELKKYDAAEIAFTNMYKKKQQSYLLFYRAISFLEQDKTSQAIADLKKHQEQKDNFYDRSMWYLALAYLKNGDTQMARKQLESIKKSGT